MSALCAPSSWRCWFSAPWLAVGCGAVAYRHQRFPTRRSGSWTLSGPTGAQTSEVRDGLARFFAGHRAQNCRTAGDERATGGPGGHRLTVHGCGAACLTRCDRPCWTPGRELAPAGSPRTPPSSVSGPPPRRRTPPPIPGPPGSPAESLSGGQNRSDKFYGRLDEHSWLS